MRADRKTDCDFNGTKKSISEKMSVTLVCLAGDEIRVDENHTSPKLMF